MKEKSIEYIINNGFELSHINSYNNILAFVKDKDLIFVNQKGLIFSNPNVIEKYFKNGKRES
jgi:hypothetical protein